MFILNLLVLNIGLAILNLFFYLVIKNNTRYLNLFSVWFSLLTVTFFVNISALYVWFWCATLFIVIVFLATKLSFMFDVSKFLVTPEFDLEQEETDNPDKKIDRFEIITDDGRIFTRYFEKEHKVSYHYEDKNLKIYLNDCDECDDFDNLNTIKAPNINQLEIFGKSRLYIQRFNEEVTPTFYFQDNNKTLKLVL
jgi:hypothetical protein